MYLSAALPIAVIIVGMLLLLRLRFFIFKPSVIGKDVKHLLKKRGAFGNLCLALSGTLGVGNIVGVAVGLTVGGAGSVFWLVLSAIPASVIKYAESSLAVYEGEGEGMMSVIRTSFRHSGNQLSRIYAVFVLLLAFAMGAALQCASFSEVFSVIFDTPPIIFGLLLIFPTLPILFFGASKIKNATALFVSTASIIYIIMSVILIFMGREGLPSALSLIIDGAFTASSVSGGLLGALCSLALREGFCRGILSNEAGLGTSAMAHSSNVGYTPHEAGLVGVLEVIFDTAVLCPLTALVLLTLGDPSEGSPVKYVLSAVSQGGAVFEFAFAAAVFCFAFSTVICWVSYGSCAYSYLHGTKKSAFRVLFIISLPLGALIGSAALVNLIDYIMLPIAVISMLTVMKNSDKVVGLYRRKNDLQNLYF